jgi:hypothetical protein
LETFLVSHWFSWGFPVADFWVSSRLWRVRALFIEKGFFWRVRAGGSGLLWEEVVGWILLRIWYIRRIDI